MSNVAQQPVVVPTNRLLSQLPVHERNAIHRGSEMLFCNVGDVLLRAQTHSSYVFFPVEAVVSVVRTLHEERSVELGLIGNEGMIGLDVIMEARTQTDDTVVQSGGSALRMPADDLVKQFHGGGALQKHLLRFTHAFLGQVAQNAVCNRFHPLSQRMAKWLLMIHDRTGVPEIESTPRLIAIALGAREREIEEAIAELASNAGIQQRRKSIAIVRDRLELSACECYETLRESYGRALAG
ncbi:MAG TPA: hypothetical protein VER58_20315 [Thermoanaerobaculia bacterium]|nr:hypothetical protein [Thermoanaerobaculia bacterium]